MDLNNHGQSSSPRVVISLLPVCKRRMKKKKKKQLGCSNNLEIVQASPACHVVYALLITTLVGFLQLMYQNMKNNDESPFATHSTNIKAFFLTFCVYCFIPLAKAVFPTHCTRYSLILSHLSLISGVISSLSLLTIFFTSWLTKLVISILGVFIPLILGRHWIKVIYERLREKMITPVFYYVTDVFRRLMRPRNQQMNKGDSVVV